MFVYMKKKSHIAGLRSGPHMYTGHCTLNCSREEWNVSVQEINREDTCRKGTVNLNVDMMSRMCWHFCFIYVHVRTINDIYLHVAFTLCGCLGYPVSTLISYNRSNQLGLYSPLHGVMGPVN